MHTITNSEMCIKKRERLKIKTVFINGWHIDSKKKQSSCAGYFSLTPIKRVFLAKLCSAIKSGIA